MRTRRGKWHGTGWKWDPLPTLALALASAGWSQQGGSGAPGPAAPGAGQSSPAPSPALAVPANSLSRWVGLPVRSMAFAGVQEERLRPLPERLAQTKGAPLDREALQKSLRQLFATGLYEEVEVSGWREGDGVALVFTGAPRTFVGTVTVDGAKGPTMNTQLLRASQLNPGTRYTPARLSQALDQMRRALAQNGFHEPTIAPTLTWQPEEQLVNIAFRVASGPQARVGAVEVSGDPGMSVDEFRRHAHLRAGAHVEQETASRALAGVLKVYRSQERLEAEIKLESEQYAAQRQRIDYHFTASKGPKVKVVVEGASVSEERLKRLIPVYEEGTVDDDLLNEGNRRLRDFYQRMGYFDVKVEHEQQSIGSGEEEIRYKVRLGARRRVERVTVTGNRYFDSATLEEMLSVHRAGDIDRHGDFSQALVATDVSALQAVYKNNGFPDVKITPEIGQGTLRRPAREARPADSAWLTGSKKGGR